MLCLFIALLIKLPVYGVHFWLPKAHVEAPTGGRIVLAGVILKLGTYGLMMYGHMGLCYAGRLPPMVFMWGAVLASLGLISQVDLKGLAAYSSVIHIRLATAALFR
jgi:NADH:ubiquinone oxidoreductase subunit 4 (subunit M)